MESRVLNDRGLSKRDQPLLIYDGECGFCSYWAARWKHAVRGAVEFQPFQELEELPGVSEAECRRAVQLVETDGEIFSGAEAVARLLSHSPRSWARLPLWAYENVPGLAPISEELYRLVADHRTAASRLNHLLWGNRFTPPGRAFSSWLFLRALGFIYLIAFISFGVQARGLVGQQGILPVVNMLDAAKAQFGSHAYWQFPTLCWFNSSDPFLMFLCWGGA
ncbi:MAG: DUF393 domain-containing protein, partial [Verrucomicrobiae bacterium]|nr:DUF393 domain-containing protein [Verrucomicrobiae bacterium]